jgi:hypothetical protein
MTVCFGGETGPGFGVDRNFLSDARSIPHDVIRRWLGSTNPGGCALLVLERRGRFKPLMVQSHVVATE